MRLFFLLSLDRIGEPERRALSGSGQGWFDLAARECALVKDPAWDELRTFLKRYGVRFKVVRA